MVVITTTIVFILNELFFFSGVFGYI